ncbi:MAG: galactitol-1-phosphate 5-dehydrogenase [Spirochaetes bacterium]|nr:galactitol-1-phosphate 5-dehydrogenase [Spirochaetota bacterium]
MKALVLERDKELVWREVPEPVRPGPEWALVKVAFSGVCNSDLHRGFGGGAYRYPLIMGHEFSGTVIEAPAGGGFASGDAVTAFPLIPCRVCAACRSGDHYRCVSYDYLGSRRDGAFAERVWVPAGNLFRVPAGVELLHAALTEPCAVARHAASKADLPPGATVAVFGGGPIGNIAGQWLRLNVAARVIVVDVDDRKLALAHSMGFEPLDARAGDPVEALHERTGGMGVDAALEAVGLPLTFRQVLAAVRHGGQSVLMGNIRGSLTLEEREVSSLLRREVTIRGTWNSRVAPEGANDWTESLARMGRGIDVAPLVSHVVPLAEGPGIFRRIMAGGEYFAKVVFIP